MPLPSPLPSPLWSRAVFFVCAQKGGSVFVRVCVYATAEAEGAGQVSIRRVRLSGVSSSVKVSKKKEESARRRKSKKRRRLRRRAPLADIKKEPLCRLDRSPAPHRHTHSHTRETPSDRPLQVRPLPLSSPQLATTTKQNRARHTLVGLLLPFSSSRARSLPLSGGPRQRRPATTVGRQSVSRARLPLALLARARQSARGRVQRAPPLALSFLPRHAPSLIFLPPAHHPLIRPSLPPGPQHTHSLRPFHHHHTRTHEHTQTRRHLPLARR